MFGLMEKDGIEQNVMGRSAIRFHCLNYSKYDEMEWSNIECISFILFHPMKWN